MEKYFFNFEKMDVFREVRRMNHVIASPHHQFTTFVYSFRLEFPEISTHLEHPQSTMIHYDSPTCIYLIRGKDWLFFLANPTNTSYSVFSYHYNGLIPFPPSPPPPPHSFLRSPPLSSLADLNPSRLVVAQSRDSFSEGAERGSHSLHFPHSLTSLTSERRYDCERQHLFLPTLLPFLLCLPPRYHRNGRDSGKVGGASADRALTCENSLRD